MNDTKLGTTPAEGAQRDAIHVAIAPVVAGMELPPGAHVSMQAGEAFAVTAPNKSIGIVDPFRAKAVQKGERFWLVLYQNTIVGMRHHWLHPDFVDDGDAKKVAEAWLQRAAFEAGVDFAEMMSYVGSDDYIHMGQNESYKSIDYEAFARHVETLTGKVGAYPPFSCSC
jgi:hypothetical protein